VDTPCQGACSAGQGLSSCTAGDEGSGCTVHGRESEACQSVAEAATRAHIVLEAVPDKLEIKSKVFAEAVSTARPGAILATNTLSIPLRKIQEARGA